MPKKNQIFSFTTKKYRRLSWSTNKKEIQKDEQGNEIYEYFLGTCQGLYVTTATDIKIIAIQNNTPGNGIFDKAIRYFEQMAYNQHKNLKIVEFYNDGLKRHLILKKGFNQDGLNVIKTIETLKQNEGDKGRFDKACSRKKV